jgi:NADPH2:quinone reductase
VVPVTSLARLPDGLSTQTAAALPLAGLTALRLLRMAGSLVGRRLLITGASGGVGHYVVELATAAGAEVVAVSATPSRGARLRELGAAQVIHEVGSAEGPFDVVMESVGGTSLPAGCTPRSAWSATGPRPPTYWPCYASARSAEMPS